MNLTRTRVTPSVWRGDYPFTPFLYKKLYFNKNYKQIKFLFVKFICLFINFIFTYNLGTLFYFFIILKYKSRHFLYKPGVEMFISFLTKEVILKLYFL